MGPFAPRARIVATLGPASGEAETIRALIEAGMDVARLNFSHGTRAEHAARCETVRRAAAAAGRDVGVIADLQGPRLRLGAFAGGAATLESGSAFTLTAAPVSGDAARATVGWAGLPRAVRPGSPILIADGAIRLEVERVEGDEVRCRVVEGGRVSDHQGLNLPGTAVDEPSLTERDAADLRFALGLGVDFVALSFVRAPEDADPVRRIMDEAGIPRPVIAKIERPEAVERLEPILERFDGLMVARGDLGVEMALEEVPLTQKRAVRWARERALPAIVATQMLESMIHDPRPTRAEASDVVNAVLDGADALMLSGETSVGRRPVEVVRTMARLIAAAERAGHAPLLPPPGPLPRSDAIAAAAVALARDTGARALIAFTRTGATARRLARHRAPVPLLAFTPDPAVPPRLALSWGVESFVVPVAGHTDAMIAQVDRALLERGLAAPGDPVVIVAGAPSARPGGTDTVRAHRVGMPGGAA